MFYRKFSLWLFTVIALPFALAAIEPNQPETITNTAKSCANPCELYCGGFSIGMNYASYSADDWAVMLGWASEWFLIDLGYNFERKINFIFPDGGRGRMFVNELRGHLGMRYRLHQTSLFFTLGAAGSYTFINPSREDRSISIPNSYSVGPFVGLDYHFSRHYLISAKILPYAFERDFTRVKRHQVFEEGSITFSYVF